MKNKRAIFVILLIILTGIYLFLRLYNFEEKANYYLDQGLHLLESYQMVDSQKIRLIGPMVTSKTFLDRGFFIGPQYYYVLAGLGLLTKWDPILIDLILLFLELGFFLYFTNWIRNKYGTAEALMVFSVITFSKYFIMHSRFFWNPHFLLPLSILMIFFLDKYIQKNKILYLAILGFLWGLSFGFHYSAVFFGIPLLIVLIKTKRIWKLAILIVPLFFVLGDLPWFIFEIRHNFYNIKTLFEIVIRFSGSERFEIYYFIHSLGVFALFSLAWLLSKINKYKILVCLILVLGLSWLQIKFIGNPSPLIHPVGWTYPIKKTVVNKILINGCPKNFNVASTVSGDARAYDLRFLLVSKGCLPMEVDEYPKAEILFLVAPVNRPPESEKVWEVLSLGKFKTIRQENLGSGIVFYELEKL
ncbi:MAG: hypothetical protein US68_C0002G0025 [Candidatus Shapirobacteria bacterium GW2011_GWE1_38_10]|uniref:Glycosyltransferase RgtA/B/C/D-like domain-containing protein n=1 Tax=Candidatus Shapirobacteria bacterium GW2011_GWE1_38_10 TaxID=1618488 RepID=A0A0G0I613_9BACT|nr:MAG: hypothetical protein US46_C0003G0017 [Candidatus Shapirobacteria bacterium GW2011_GWF2_37_20]KKQ50748.1 MAG: hypothetical protein US68_C0002G0025 [Candidatus Shapirobacteria bacterium GW2011_GWE1_38_10]KKQ64498.1 MAG: hypothetical protein US85_C0008G0027 [Candidatus Shapirobacteria bacterium GW2011_GWF1_38_23]HBP51251.1 hypothetical protein [Candidatus Shapirobacteria bacterium]